VDSMNPETANVDADADGGSRPVSAVYPRLQVLKVFPSFVAQTCAGCRSAAFHCY
jgi:hypothetical protein